MPIPAGMMTGDAGVDVTELASVVDGVKAAEGWSDADANDAELWYRRFLALTNQQYQTSGQLKAVFGIDKRSDLIWHAHIDDDAKYRADNATIFGAGQYLTHTPGQPPNWQQLLQAAMALYRRRFHQVPPYASTCCT